MTKLYNERYRPQFHFSAKKGWLQDPNGCVYYKGDYHLFFQYNSDPSRSDLGKQNWGHAVSRDLVHWEQWDNAIRPDENGAIWSGSAVVDWNNTTGLQTGKEKVIVAVFTYAGSCVTPEKPHTQAIAYSNDRCRTMVKYQGNPVLENQAGGKERDPKILWHEPTKQWVMVLYLDREKNKTFGIFTSPDLKEWTKQSEIGEFYECPDLFELPVEAEPESTRLVLHDGTGNYVIGKFDGKQFIVESGPHYYKYRGNFYAAQSFSDMPKQDGRRIQIGWMMGSEYPDMPFNQQMTFPCVLTLRRTPDGIRLCREPVKEIEYLYMEEHTLEPQTFKPGDNPLAGIKGELLDIWAEFEIGGAEQIVFNVRGEPVVLDIKKSRVSLEEQTEMKIVDGKINIRMLVDRSSIEIFVSNGLIAMYKAILFDPDNLSLELCAKGGEAKVVSLVVHELKSTWQKKVICHGQAKKVK